MGDYIMESAALADNAFIRDQQIIGHFEAGPAGVGPMTNVTTGEFYPILPVPETASASASGEARPE